MTSAPISNEIALRIGLAARELPDTDAARLLRVLTDLIGLPPAAKKLDGLKVKDLKTAADGEFADIDTTALKAALTCLKGEYETESESLPAVQTYLDGDLPHSIRVACASNKGELLDGHFGSCRRFLIYQVAQDESRLIDIRHINDAEAEDDKNEYRASLIRDCQLLFVSSIGGPAAAKVVKAGVHPIKKPEVSSAVDEIQRLQGVVGKGASPWLAKVMGQTPEERVRFEQEEHA
ncbi:MAG: dinitrogenase iron-molybdenum cofactor biosynthesis protein [Chromatiales bacterium]|jgi:nitrogen fixation protein NifX